MSRVIAAERARGKVGGTGKTQCDEKRPMNNKDNMQYADIILTRMGSCDILVLRWYPRSDAPAVGSAKKNRMKWMEGTDGKDISMDLVRECLR